MTKTIPVTLVIIAFAITGVMVTGSIYGLIAHELTHIKTKNQPADCETPSGGTCGEGKLRGDIKLLQQTLGETETGIGQGEFFVRNGGLSPNGTTLKSNNLTYEYDYNEIVLMIQGTAKDNNEEFWDVEIIGNNFETKQELKGTIDLDITLESQTSGNKITQTASATVSQRDEK